MTRDHATFVSWVAECLASAGSEASEATVDAAWTWASQEIGIRTAMAVVGEGWFDGDTSTTEVRLRGGPTVALRRPGAFGHPTADPDATIDPRVADPLALWRWVCERRPVDREADARVEAELADSRFNLALCRVWAQLTPTRPDHDDGESTVLLGHPWHPMTKTRLGLSLAEHWKFAPELAAEGPVAVVEARCDRVVASRDFADRIAPIFGRADDGWIRIPVHAGQRQRLPRLLGGRWGRDVRPVERPDAIGRSLLSLRTVALADGHYKLAFDIHTTSARRLVSAMSVYNGPRVTALLERIRARDPETAGRVRVAAERHAAGLDSSKFGSIADQLGVIVRPAADFESARGRLICCAALGSTRPGASGPMVEALLAGYDGSSSVRAAAMLRDYAGLLLPPLLRLLTGWGIALEPHLQNTLVEVVDGRPSGFVVRDLGGIRIHRGRLQAAGETIDVHPDSFIVTDDLAELRGKLAHCVLHAHLATLIGWLEDHTALPSSAAWRIVAETLRERFEAWSTEPNIAANVEADRTGLFAPRVRAKALFTMRIQDRSSDYHYVDVDNPLRAVASKTA